MLVHGFKINHEKCRGKLSCMRACPTRAIRVKGGKAAVLSDLCIDCGSCLKVCPSGAIESTTHSLKQIGNFKYKVAVPSPVLFGHFPMAVSPVHIIEGLKSLGFDSVYFFPVEAALVNRAIHHYVDKWKGRFPLISSSCPVIIRLIHVSYPGMIEQLIPVLPPRELASQQVKVGFSKELGIAKDQIGAIYITSCQAKRVSILESDEGTKSNTDGAIGISSVYNGILTAKYQNNKKTSDQKPSFKDLFHDQRMLQWSMFNAQRTNLQGCRYMSLTGLSNIIRVFDDIEKGKLRNFGFLECYACWAGCINGNLTVDNFYVTRHKLRHLMAELPEKDAWVESEVERRYAETNFFGRSNVKQDPLKNDRGHIKQRIERIKKAEAVLATLPGLNCGLCGAPNCRTHAMDIASGESQQTDCIFYSKDSLEKLRRIHVICVNTRDGMFKIGRN